MIQGILANWKTSALGLFVGAMVLASAQYQHGMTWKSWGVAVATALWGLVSRDFNVTSEKSGAK